MLKKAIFSVLLLSTISACSNLYPSKKYQEPQNLLFNNNDLYKSKLTVTRDEKLCANDKTSQQKCPIKFYIDDIKAGDFYINNSTTYHLKPNGYVLTVKNCNTLCDTFHTKINIDSQLQPVSITLSLDKNNKPIIINKK